MKGVDPRLADLLALAELIADQAQQPLLKAQARVAKIDARIGEIATHRAALMQVGPDDPTMAGTMLAQAERLRRLQARETMRLAEATAALGEVQAATRRAIGRKLALEKLEARQRTKAARLKRPGG